MTSSYSSSISPQIADDAILRHIIHLTHLTHLQWRLLGRGDLAHVPIVILKQDYRIHATIFPPLKFPPPGVSGGFNFQALEGRVPGFKGNPLVKSPPQTAQAKNSPPQ